MPRKPFPSKPSLNDSRRRVLIVEDSPTDRDLLRYLLEEHNTVIREAMTLQAAINLLDREGVDCVILDLQLPDSTGANTFRELSQRFPHVPLIVMTHNKDRQLAIEMVREGAADYIIKNFLDMHEGDEDLYQRILFAIERHRRTIRVAPDDAKSVQRLDKAQADLRSAHESGQHSAIRDTTVEMNAAMADLSRRMFAEIQTVANQLTIMKAIEKTVDTLDTELLRGTPGRASMRSQMDLINHRLTTVESNVKVAEKKIEDEEEKRRQEEKNLRRDTMSNRTKVIIAVLGLLGILAGGIITYYTALHKPADSGDKK